MTATTPGEQTGSAVLSAALNAIVSAVLFVGLLQLPGRDPDRLVWFDGLAWFIYVFPPINILSAVLALFGGSRPRLRRFTWGAAAGGVLYAVYLVAALFVFY